MATNLTQAKKLLNATELELFDASRGVNVKSLSAAQLRTKIKRTRTLRDKARDRLRRQKVATRSRTGSKLGKSGVANVRTAQKGDVLSEVLDRFEARARQVEAADKRKAAKTAKTAKTKSSTRTSGKKVAGKAPATAVLKKALKKKRAATKAKATTERKPPEPKGASQRARGKEPQRTTPRIWESGLQRIEGHVSTQVRRAQGKRDSR